MHACCKSRVCTFSSLCPINPGLHFAQDFTGFSCQRYLPFFGLTWCLMISSKSPNFIMALLKILSSPYCQSATPFNICISVTDYNSDGIVLGGGDVNVLISSNQEARYLFETMCTWSVGMSNIIKSKQKNGLKILMIQKSRSNCPLVTNTIVFCIFLILFSLDFFFWSSKGRCLQSAFFLAVQRYQDPRECFFWALKEYSRSAHWFGFYDTYILTTYHH